MNKYKPIDPIKSPRFSGIQTFMRLPFVKKLEGVDFAIIGVPSDAGASFRTGQREGPAAIRKISALLRHHNPILNISPYEFLSGIDYGDLPVVPGYIEEGYKRIEESLLPVLEAGIIPILLGGDHAITLPELRAITKIHGPVSLLHFDSHSDTVDEYFGMPYNHGTPFKRAVEENLLLADNSIQVGLRGSIYSPEHLEIPKSLGFDIVTTEEIREIGLDSLIERIKNRIGKTKVFLSFDIDFVDPAYAPGTGTPEVGGFTSGETLKLIRGLKDLNYIGFDVVEVLPASDPSEITALLAANIVYEFISILAYIKKKK
ncbi:MAG: agmatinase [Candidatus Heimdallarchaeota archaeon]|nr:agmatinase [Candidatus Heimdallarchaeota archaeon]MCG3256565.1 agmatinase [Candidatus Heimdallarchaeota archaeon]MCK4611629.1 agmatinase [Candidatus Heimdallarchaeota archaeon]